MRTPVAGGGIKVAGSPLEAEKNAIRMNMGMVVSA
jgi:hypothetical protein